MFLEFSDDHLVSGADLNDNCIYLIDLENVSKDWSIIENELITRGIEYYSFASIIGTVPATEITHCTRKDAADILMIVKLTELVIGDPEKKYIVVSRDKLLATAVEVVREKYNATIEHLVKIDSFNSFWFFTH